MDYFIKLIYAPDMKQNDKSNFLYQIRKFNLLRLKRTEYILDRESLFEDFKKVAQRFNVDYKYEEHEELPRSLKNLLEEKASIQVRDQVRDQDLQVLKDAFKSLFEMYLKLSDPKTDKEYDPKIETFEDYFDRLGMELDNALIDKAVKIVEEGS